jgi:hypothetical protein
MGKGITKSSKSPIIFYWSKRILVRAQEIIFQESAEM